METLEIIQTTKLRFGSDQKPGIKRVRSGTSFHYIDPEGKTVNDKETLERIRKLVIPPGWHDVWISPYPNSHLQATGRDDRGRKQYRYHATWVKVSQQSKYGDLLEFAQALPKIRRQVKRDMSHVGMPREKVITMWTPELLQNRPNPKFSS